MRRGIIDATGTRVHGITNLDKPCPSTSKPASTENSGWASLPVTKPFGPGGDASVSTSLLAVTLGTQLPMALSSTGASMLLPTPLSMALCPSHKSFESAREPRAVVNAGGGVAPKKSERSGDECWCHAPIGRRAKSVINTCGTVANRGPINDAGASTKGIVIPRQAAQTARGSKRSGQSRRGLNPIGQVANSGQRHRIAPIGQEAKSRGQCIIIVVVLNEVVEIRQRHQRIEVDDRIVVILLGISRGVVSFDLHHIDLVLAHSRRWRGVVEKDEGAKWPSNMLPKMIGNAHCLAGILSSDGLIVGHNCVGALVAHPGVAALAWPPCFGAGTQLHEEQVAAIKQKQQKSLRALVIFYLLYFQRLLGGTLTVDEERLTLSVLFARRVCSWRWLSASTAGPGAPDNSGSHSSSITYGG
jgi:hypothetical protein